MSTRHRYRLLVENSSDLLAEMTRDGRIVYVTPNFETVLGYLPTELIGHSVFEYVHPDDRAAAQENFILPEASLVVRYRHKRGQWRWLEVTGRDFTTPDGAERGVLIARDVTARCEAEKSLRSRERHLRAVLDNALVAVVTASSTGAILEWNAQAERLFGWRRDEIMGRDLTELLIPKAQRAKFAALLRRQCKPDQSTAMPPPVEMPLRQRDGREIPVELSVTPIPAREGFVHCAFLRDLSGLKDAQAARTQLEVQLCQAQKLEAVGRLASGIAHDFNNILAVIAANNEMARLEAGAAHPATESLGEIQRACQRATDLVRRILTFSRPQALERRELEMPAVVREAIKMFRPVLPATIKIRTVFESACPAVWADPSQLTQVLLNLATNAAHAMRQHGGVLEIAVTAERIQPPLFAAHPEARAGNYLKLSVRDTGHGMAAEVADRIFEPFFTTKPPGEGTGLGLSVVHGIVKSHGGFMSVTSKPGHGATFNLYFPALAPVAPPPPGDAAAPVTGNGEPVLFVEDEGTLAASSRLFLQRLGYRPTVCRDGTEALTVLQNTAQPFACIICDLNVPGHTGVELAQQSRRYRKETPFILTSGEGLTLNADALKRSGVTALLEKPFTPQELAQTLRRAIDHSKHCYA